MLHYKYTYNHIVRSQTRENVTGTYAAENLAIAKQRLANRYGIKAKFEVKPATKHYPELHTAVQWLSKDPRINTQKCLIVSAIPITGVAFPFEDTKPATDTDVDPSAPESSEADVPDGAPAPTDTPPPEADKPPQ